MRVTAFAKALAVGGVSLAVDALRGPTGGIPNWRTAMASVVLAACRPERYTIAHSGALRTMMCLEGQPSHVINNTRYFPRSRWEGVPQVGSLGILQTTGRLSGGSGHRACGVPELCHSL